MFSYRRKQRAKSYFSHALHTLHFFVPLFNAFFVSLSQSQGENTIAYTVVSAPRSAC